MNCVCGTSRLIISVCIALSPSSCKFDNSDCTVILASLWFISGDDIQITGVYSPIQRPVRLPQPQNTWAPHVTKHVTWIVTSCDMSHDILWHHVTCHMTYCDMFCEYNGTQEMMESAMFSVISLYARGRRVVGGEGLHPPPTTSLSWYNRYCLDLESQ